MRRPPQRRKNSPLALLEGLRPKQWVKNFFLFAGIVFTGHTFEAPYLYRVLGAFAVFCALASGHYLINDVWDRNEDRRHPKKRKRPVASGRLTPGFAMGMGVGIALAALGGAWFLQHGRFLQHTFFLSAAAYLFTTLAYTVALKRIVLLDLLILAGLFVLRAAAGALVISVPISPWLLICTTLIALFLGLGKRRHELATLTEDAGKHRRSLDDYTLPFIDQMISIVTAATLMAYTLYTFSSETATLHHGMLLTTPFVMYGLFRYLYLIYVKGQGGQPELDLLGDAPSLINFALWTLIVLGIFLWQK